MSTMSVAKTMFFSFLFSFSALTDNIGKTTVVITPVSLFFWPSWHNVGDIELKVCICGHLPSL